MVGVRFLLLEVTDKQEEEARMNHVLMARVNDISTSNLIDSYIEIFTGMYIQRLTYSPGWCF